MNSTQIACFLAAAQAESFSMAADSMYMSPPTFGRHISALEKELGFPLFQRGWKNSRLTPGGAVMLEGLSKMSEEYRALLARAAVADSGVTGRLTLGLLEGQLVDTELRNALQSFGQRFPGIELELRRYSFRDMLEALGNFKLDVAITLTVELTAHPELNSLPMYSVENDIVLSAGSPLASREGLSLVDFAQETFVEIEQEDSPIISGLMGDSCRKAGFQPRTCVVPDLKAQISAVELGRGVAAFNRFHQTCNHPGLTHVSVPELPPVEFSMAWNENNENKALPHLISQFQESFGEGL